MLVWGDFSFRKNLIRIKWRHNVHSMQANNRSVKLPLRVLWRILLGAAKLTQILVIQQKCDILGLCDTFEYLQLCPFTDTSCIRCSDVTVKLTYWVNNRSVNLRQLMDI